MAQGLVQGIRPVALYEDQLEISVPNTFAKEYIESRFRPLLEEALDDVVGQGPPWSSASESLASTRGTGPPRKVPNLF